MFYPIFTAKTAKVSLWNNQLEKIDIQDKKIADLQEKLDYMICQKFASSSEKFPNNQPALFFNVVDNVRYVYACEDKCGEAVKTSQLRLEHQPIHKKLIVWEIVIVSFLIFPLCITVDLKNKLPLNQVFLSLMYLILF